MPQFYAEILRSPGPHDNSFRLLNSNDPSPATIAWAKDIGVTATSDGDILTFSGSSPGLGVTWFPGSTSYDLSIPYRPGESCQRRYPRRCRFQQRHHHEPQLHSSAYLADVHITTHNGKND